jgi:formylglycine-generating enzyme required for sulfatase activity
MKWVFGAFLGVFVTIGAHPAFSQSPAETVLKDAGAAVTAADSGLSNRQDFAWVSIPGGTAVLGCSHGDKECVRNEKPRFKARVAPFRIMAHEVTQAQYKLEIGKNPSKFSSCGNDCPVEQVTWDEAKAFCAKIGGRLPTEQEWEYAARAGTLTEYYCGTDCLDTAAWYDKNSNGQTHPVDKKQSNAWGLFDMLGNVSEWVEDCYSSGYDSSPDCRNRVVRNGSWSDGAGFLRVSERLGLGLAHRDPNVGFRCVSPAPAPIDTTSAGAVEASLDKADIEMAKRWGLDFSETPLCRNHDPNAGIEGYGTMFKYAATRTGTLMNALGLAAQIAWISCIEADHYYCGTMVSLFGSDEAETNVERLKLRDFVKRFGTAKPQERKAVVRTVAAQLELCGLGREMTRFAAAMTAGLDAYESQRVFFEVDKCRAACDPRTKEGWGKAGGGAQSTDTCFMKCPDIYSAAPLLTRFIHRRVVSGISVKEMRELTAIFFKTASPE